MERDHDRSDHHLGPKFPDYDPALEQQRAEQGATARRLEREEHDLQSGKVAGHDFVRECHERDRSGRG